MKETWREKENKKPISGIKSNTVRQFSQQSINGQEDLKMGLGRNENNTATISLNLRNPMVTHREKKKKRKKERKEKRNQKKKQNKLETK